MDSVTAQPARALPTGTVKELVTNAPALTVMELVASAPVAVAKVSAAPFRNSLAVGITCTHNNAALVICGNIGSNGLTFERDAMEHDNENGNTEDDNGGDSGKYNGENTLDDAASPEPASGLVKSTGTALHFSLMTSPMCDAAHALAAVAPVFEGKIH